MRKLLLMLLLLLTLPCASFAQDAADQMEQLFSQQENAVDRSTKDEQQAAEKPQSDVKNLADLAKLAPFSDVAVIQKRYLPRTGRFEAFGAVNTILNDAFFTNIGLDGRLAYYFKEKYGVELIGMHMITAQRETTKDLHDKQFITTTSLVVPKNYFGADFKWIPVYGKVSFLNDRITHFDMYFSGGLGDTSTSVGSSPTLHLGTGQNFALSKAFTIRWDLSWNFYKATSNLSSTSSTSLYNNLMLGIGVSFFFPEATYR